MSVFSGNGIVDAGNRLLAIEKWCKINPLSCIGYIPKMLFGKNITSNMLLWRKSATRISLGRNCEVAFGIVRHGFRLESSLLNWACIYTDHGLFQAISNPLNVFSDQYSLASANMFRCDSLNIDFHARESFENWKELSVEDPCLLSAVSELKSRSRYLGLKLQSQLKGPRLVDAFLKPPRQTRSGLEVFCHDLRRLVDDVYPDNNVRFWVVIEGQEASIELVDGLREVYITRVSEYTPDAESDAFSEQSSKDWRSLIVYSQSFIQRPGV